MRKAILIVTVLFIAVISTACINNFAVQELNNKAQVYMQNGDYEAAINRLEASLDLDNTIFETNYNLGVAYIKAKKYKKACETLDNAIKLNPDNMDAWFSLGVASEEYADELLAKEEEKALSDEEAISPEDSDSRLSDTERKEKAVGLYNAAVQAFARYLAGAADAKDTDVVKAKIDEIKQKVSELEG